MKAVFLFLSLLIAMPATQAAAHEDHDHSAQVECDCPSDCPCRKPGGTCPANGPCSPDCKCEHHCDVDGRGIWVHPEMRAAIKANEEKQNRSGLRTAAGPIHSSDFEVIDGKRYPTGYKPTWEQYDGAQIKRSYELQFQAGEIPKTFSLRKLSFSPVRGQQCGDCWAQGGVSAFEITVNYIDRLSRVYSVQDSIDNSGFGSCNGGQLSMKHFEKGAVLESDYPYLHGRNGPKKPNFTPRYEKTKRTFYLRGADGKFPTLQEIQASVKANGSHEVCGSASALGSGGRQDSVRNGGTNHCYALTGWVDGKEMGWLDATYLEIKNSWGGDESEPLSNGREWGDGGYGYYPLAKGDGVHLKGSVITEIQGFEYKPMVPPEPVKLNLENSFATAEIVIQPGCENSQETVQDVFQKAMK